MTLLVPIFKAENCKSPFLRMSDQIWEVNCEKQSVISQTVIWNFLAFPNM